MIHRRIALIVWILFYSKPIGSNLFREFVATPNARTDGPTCLDGSDAVFYHSYDNKPNGESDFLFYLQPGGYCHNIETCRFRCSVASYMCTAPQHMDMSYLEGILSEDPDINPAFASFYKVIIPYCSGDMFTGSRNASEQTDGFAFHGRLILETIAKRMRESGLLTSARRVVLAGSSAGGAGVAFNCDYFASLMKQPISLRCIIDGAFFYPVSQPFRDDPNCESIDTVLEQGARLWSAPGVGIFPLHGPWWSTIEHPILITSAVIDQFGFQSYCGDKGNLTDIQIWANGSQALASLLATRYPHVSLFMPACYDHMLLIDDDVYSKVKVGNGAHAITLAHTVNMWINDNVAVHVTDTCDDVHDVTCNTECPNNALTYWQMTNFGFH